MFEDISRHQSDGVAQELLLRYIPWFPLTMLLGFVAVAKGFFVVVV